MESSYIQIIRRLERNMAGLILFLPVRISMVFTGIVCPRAEASAQAWMQMDLATEGLG